MRLTAGTVGKTLQFLRGRRTAYQLLFAQPTGQEILRDLVKFTKILHGPYGRTDAETYRLIGRQDVMRRIQQHCGLTPEQLFALYNDLPVTIIKERDEEDNG